MSVATRCVAVLGGSFDPVHAGHVALADYFTKLLAPDELLLLPAGNPWQKAGLQATPEQRMEMLQIAFRRLALPVRIDRREIERNGPTYTIDTLRALRAELGPSVSIAFLLGADQLQKLHSWKEWRQLFDYAHLCVASRPGFSLQHADLAPEVAREFQRREASAEQLRTTPAGLVCVAGNLAFEISATAIREALVRHESPNALLPAGVLDYIKSHHLYNS